jgi:hypothetical protein
VEAFGKYLQNLPPVKAAVGFLFMAIGAAFFVGASTANLLEKPAQVSRNTEVNAIQDTAIANIIIRQADQMEEVQESFERVFCFLRLVIEDERPIPAMACEPEGSGTNGGRDES